MIYQHHCSDCGDQVDLTQEERDLLLASEDPLICWTCLKKDPEPEPEPPCRCTVHYGMRKSFRGPGYFQDADPGVYTDSSKCPIHD